MNACIASGEALPATERLAIITTLIPRADSNGRSAAQPTAAKLGRRTIKTPANAAEEAIHVSRRAGSCRISAASKAVIIGLVKVSAVAAASGMTNTAEKNPTVARATASPRIAWICGTGMTKARGPCRTSRIAPSPAAPSR